VKIVTLASQKGGVGKSTLALNIYSTFLHNGATAALVDTDPQGSLRNIQATLKDNPQWGGVELMDYKQFKQLAEGGDSPYDIVVVDTPPYLSDKLENILQWSDVVLMPCKPSPLDILSMENTIELVKEAQAKNKKLKAGIVLNMVFHSTQKYTDQILEILNTNYDVPLLRTQIRNRVAYSRAMFKDSSVDSENNKKATQEMTALIQEMLIL